MRPRLLFAVTDAQSLALLRGQLAFARAAGAEVYVMSSLSAQAAGMALDERAAFLPVEIERSASPLRDLRALCQIVRVVHDLSPDLIDASTPKAAFLLGVAGWLNRVPVRIHTLRGLRHETMHGVMRQVLLAIEWTTCRLAHRVICISPSLRDHAIELGVVDPGRAVALGAGCASGVDLRRFTRTPASGEAGRRFRSSHGISAEARVVGFVGRIARDKGIATLLEAWRRLRTLEDRYWLVVVGDLDATDPVDGTTLAALRADPRVVMAGRLEQVATAYAALDVLVLPSLREGLGNVLVEAAAMELPVVASRIPGCVDAVQHGVTGELVPAADPARWCAAIARYLGDPELCARHGGAGRQRVERLFQQDAALGRLVALYRTLLAAHGGAPLVALSRGAS